MVVIVMLVLLACKYLLARLENAYGACYSYLKTAFAQHLLDPA
jgi:hypothetical protein